MNLKYEVGQEIIVEHTKMIPSTVRKTITVNGVTIGKDGVAKYLTSLGAFTESTLDAFGQPIPAIAPAQPEPQDKPKFKVGDKVRIRTDMSVGKTYGRITYLDSMSHFAGEAEIITEFEPSGNVMLFGWYWDISMLEPYTSPAFDWDAFRAGKVAVHCDTEKKAKAFIARCQKEIPDECKAWRDGKTHWEQYEKETGYANYHGLSYCYTKYFKEKGYTIIDYPFEPEQPKPLMVTREMLVKLGACNGGLRIFDTYFSSGKTDYDSLLAVAKNDYESRMNNHDIWVVNHKSRIEQMQNEPKEAVKLYCVKSDMPYFTQGNMYEFNGTTVKMDNRESTTYKSIDEFWKVNAEWKRILYPLVSRPAKVGEWVLILDNAIGTAEHYHNKVVKITSMDGNVPCFTPDNKPEYAATLCQREYLVLDGYRGEQEG